MGRYVCDDNHIIIQVTGFGHDNPNQQLQQIMFYEGHYQTPLENVKAQESPYPVPENSSPDRHECPSILFEYPKENIIGKNLGIRIPKEAGGYIHLPLVNSFQASTQADRANLIYKPHRVWSIVPMTKIESLSEKLISDNNHHEPSFSRVQSDPLYSVTREGYFYVFVNGVLWRELKIVNTQQNTTQYQDIDLASYKENDQNTLVYRKPTGKALDDIWIPAAFPNEQQNVQLAYSEEQWPTERIHHLENNTEARNARCTTLASDTTVQNFTNRSQATSLKTNQPFKTAAIKDHRVRDFKNELLIDNVVNYTSNLSSDYLQNLVEINQHYFAMCADRKALVSYDLQKTLLDTISNSRFDTSAWLSIIYNQDHSKHEDIKAISELWPAPTDRYKTYQPRPLPEVTAINQTTNTVPSALASAKDRYLLGVYVDDSTFAVHHLTVRISMSIVLLQKMQELAKTRNSYYLASLVNVQRRFFSGLNEAINSVGSPEKQNLYYSTAEVERLGIAYFIDKCQKQLANNLSQSQFHEALADLLSDHNPVDYAGHMLFILLALRSISGPAEDYDELTSFPPLTNLTEGQQFINSISQGGYQKLKAMLQSSKPDEQILIELEQYFTSSTEPTSNLGDGAFRANVLRELGQQLNPNNLPQARTYNGAQIRELATALDKPSSNQEQQQRESGAEATGITSLKAISSALTTIAITLPVLYQKAEAALHRSLAITHQEINPKTVQIDNNQRRQTTTPNQSPPDVMAAQSHHAQMYYNLREILPDPFKDMRFVMLSSDSIINGGYTVAVNDVTQDILKRNMTSALYNTEVRLLQAKPGTSLETIFIELDQDITSARWQQAYERAATQVWEKAMGDLATKPPISQEQAYQREQTRQQFLENRKQDIVHRMITNAVDDAIASGHITDYGSGTLQDMYDRNIGLAHVEAAERVNEIHNERAAAQAASAQDFKTAGTVNYSGLARKIDNALNGRVAASIFFMIEIYNIKTFATTVDDLIANRSITRAAFGVGSLVFDTANASLFLLERIAWINQGQRLTSILSAETKLLPGLSARSFLMRGALILTIGLSLSDACYEMMEGRTERALLYTTIAAGAAVMYFSGGTAAATILFGLGPLGLLGLALIIGGAVGLYFCNPSDIKDWIKQGPFADTDALFFPSAKGHLAFYEEAHYRFLSLLANIRVKAEKNDKYNVLHLTNNPTELDRKLNRANIKVTLESNLPGLVNMLKENGEIKVRYQASYSDSIIAPDITVYSQLVHEENTVTGKILYLRIHNDATSFIKPGKTDLTVWVQVKTELNYFNTKEVRYFPAPVPSKDILWNENEYSEPNFKEDTTEFWHSQTFENLI